MVGFLLGKELENGDIKYGLCFSEPSMYNKEGLLKSLDSLFSDKRHQMLKKNMPLRVVSKDIYLGDASVIGRIGGIEQKMSSKVRYYLSKDGELLRYSGGTLSVID